MFAPLRRRRVLGVRWSLALLPLLAFLLTDLGGTAPRAAQKKPPAREEEEEPVRPKLKPPPRVEEDELPAQPVRRIGARAVDLRREAEQAKNPVVRAFYLRLAVPHDEVSFPTGIRAVQTIAPLPEYVGPHPRFSGKLRWRCLDAQGQLGKEEAMTRAQIIGIVHYEALAVSQVDDLLMRANSEPPPVSRLEQLQCAEKALAEVVRFHEEAWERGIRKGSTWEELDRRLRGKLLEVRLGQLRALAEGPDWTGTLELAAQLVDIYPHHPEVRSAIIQVHVRRALRALDEGRPETFVAAREALDQLERQFPNAGNDDAALALRRRLQAKAGSYLRRAQETEATDKLKAQAYLRTAESIWPKLEAGDLRQRLQPYQPLRVGVSQLPQRISPAAAVTDSERQAVELVFESLVRPVPDPAVGSRYEPVLAAERPQLVPLGRQFELVRDARWYRAAGPNRDPAVDEPLIGSDVLATVDCYQHWEGRSPAWDELLAGARDVRRDPFRVRLNLQRGYCDPLALMTFKILPVKYLRDGRADDPAFARNPIGSGPYQYLGLKSGDSRTGSYAQFQANPAYGSRAGKTGLPHIREIHFFHSRDPIQDFRNGTLHLLLDLPTDRIRALKSPAAGLGHVAVHTLRNRRVYFLAVNHRQTALKSRDLRRAIGLAIDREKILDDCFRDHYRDDKGQPVHRILNGPYPPGCWACDPAVKQDLRDLTKARSFAPKTASALELLYPAELPHVAEACEAIRVQVELATGIRLTPRGLPLADFHRAVAVDHKYDLAYFWWDHPNDSYWLGPLFDSRGSRGLLGPVEDGDLENLFSDVLSHREFALVQAKTRQIHRLLAERMPLIPLWQLDTHLAIHSALKTFPEPAKLDPLLIFPGAERWRLGK